MALPINSKMPNAVIVTQDGKQFNLRDLPSMYLFIGVVPRIEASVSQKQSKFLEEQSDLFENVIFITISTDTPEEQKRWMNDYRISNQQVFSDIEGEFGKAFEIYDEDTASDAQSIFIFDQNKNLIYQETVKGGNPDFDASIGQLKMVMDD